MTHHVHNPHANDELVVVLETSNPATAAVVESILEEGLTFNLQGESLQEMIVVPFAAPIRVQVLKKDEARARELLKDIE